ncbi:uncharacterized protein LOC110982989 isoform X2 [Acanthaster planci]|uniref:Uncharacterized protein LOC110982989 isoform X2 n=1 Tax=Acanthaster planci TaxID=133434 RepID=A0A8B7YW21_ACAPL|nr:uncharacterized protein LOC110982989 isoform X2 [Acanthaster planci]
MQYSTKKCILTYSGAIMFAFGFGIMLDGIFYRTTGATSGAVLNSAGNAVVKSVPHWCGLLLILLGARNFTFGIAQWKYGVNCCGGGACEVLFVNLMALIVSLAAVGLAILGSWDVLNNASASSIGSVPDFTYLISIWFMSLMCAILALMSMCAGCLPVGEPQEEIVEDY